MQLYLDGTRFNLVLTAVLSNCQSLFVLKPFIYKIINLVIIYGPLRIEVIKGSHTLKTHIVMRTSQLWLESVILDKRAA